MPQFAVMNFFHLWLGYISWVSNGPFLFDVCFCVCVCVYWPQGLVNAKHTCYHWATLLVVPTVHFFCLSSLDTGNDTVESFFFKGYASCVPKSSRQKLYSLPPPHSLCDRSFFSGLPFSKAILESWTVFISSLSSHLFSEADRRGLVVLSTFFTAVSLGRPWDGEPPS
jgi:hypothetical protein